MKKILNLAMVLLLIGCLLCGCSKSGSVNSDSALLSEVNGDIAVELAINYSNAFHTNTVLTNVSESSDGIIEVTGHFDLNVRGKGNLGEVYFSGEYTKDGENNYTKNYFELDF